MPATFCCCAQGLCGAAAWGAPCVFTSTCTRLTPGNALCTRSLSNLSWLATSAPDGYTLLFGGVTELVLNPQLVKVPYDVVRDFAPVTRTDLSPLVVVVHPSLPAKSVGDLVKLAKARPGAINYASAGPQPSVAGSGVLTEQNGSSDTSERFCAQARTRHPPPQSFRSEQTPHAPSSLTGRFRNAARTSFPALFQRFENFSSRTLPIRSEDSCAN